MSNVQLPASMGNENVLTYERTDGSDVCNVQAVAVCNMISNVIGALTAVAQAITADITDSATAVIAITGTYGSVAVSFEATVDGINWFPIQGARSDSATVETASGTLTSTARAWEFTCAGWYKIRARCTAWTSGTMAVVIGLSAVGYDPSPVAQLAAGSNVIGYTALGVKTSGGATPSKTISAATTNATSLKASAGTLYTAHAFNSGATACYIKFYNKASAPTVGTDVPVLVIGIPAGASIDVGIPESIGVAFGTGIAFAITGGMADTDATAVALNQVALSMTYA